MSTQEMQCEHPFCACCWTAGSIMESKLAEARAEIERLGDVVSMYTDVLIAKDTSIKELTEECADLSHARDSLHTLLRQTLSSRGYFSGTPNDTPSTPR